MTPDDTHKNLSDWVHRNLWCNRDRANEAADEILAIVDAERTENKNLREENDRQALRIQKVLSRLTMERDSSRAYAKEGETYQHDLGAMRAWAFGLAVSVLDGTEPLEDPGVPEGQETTK